ncbi:hypothetical protein ACFYN3_41585 [Streptomyces lavendulae]|uniref:hypothetical protein n=1 Tax=Streptomyces lavendulae TaxID=1914 RepID=UPI00369B9792
MSCTGATAVFVVETEAGPAALIIIGAILFLVAMVGRQIKEISLTEGIFTPEELKEVLRNTQTPEDVLTIASAASTAAPEIQSDPEVQHLTAAAYEQILAKNLTEIFGQEAVQAITGPYDLGIDILVSLGGKKAGIQTKFGRTDMHFTDRRMREAVQWVLRGSPDADAVIIVSNMHEPSLSILGAARDRAQASGKTFQYVRWNPDGDTTQLERVIRDHLGA